MQQMAILKKNQDTAYFLSFCIEQWKTKRGISGAEATKQIYSSPLYQQLEREDTKLWQHGPVALYEESF